MSDAASTEVVLPDTTARKRRWLTAPWRWVAFVIGVAILRLIWGAYASHQVETELAKIRSAGEPVRVEDVVFPSVPTSEDAWPIWTNAMAAVSRTVDSPANSNIEYPPYEPFNQAWRDLAVGSEAANVQAFALARKTEGRTRAKFNSKLASPLLSYFPAALNTSRTLANVLGDGVLHAHLDLGDDEEALHRVQDTLRLAATLRQDDPLIVQLVATGIDALAVDRLQQIAPGLHFEAGSTTRPATRERARQLISTLLDDEPVYDGLKRAMKFERLFAIEYNHYLSNGTWVIRPLADLSLARHLRNLDVYVHSSDLRDFPTLRSALSGLTLESNAGQNLAFLLGTPPPKAVPRYSRWYSIDGGLDRAFETIFRVVAERRMTAVSVAMQLYRADHGTWPASLDDLVPAYLKSIPADPFRADGGPVGYRVLKSGLPDGSDRPLVFVDTGDASDRWIDSEPMYGWQSGSFLPRGIKNIRQFRDVSRWTPKERRYEKQQAEQAAGRAIGP